MKNILIYIGVAIALVACGDKSSRHTDFTDVCDKYGAVVKRDGVGKTIYFVFTADSLFEGASVVLDVLDKHDVKGSFFFTGNCLRMDEHKDVVKRVISSGHNVGCHSDRHILYADWDNDRTNMVSNDSLKRDIEDNYAELAKLGVTKDDAPYFLPPYEWYNSQNIEAIRSMGLVPVNFTPRTYTCDDYTTPDMTWRYKTSQELMDKLYDYERDNTLDGRIILIHPGTSPHRTDKLYNRLDEIFTTLIDKGYKMERL